jgi:hypothetical protein
VTVRERISALERLQGSAYEDHLLREGVLTYQTHQTANPGTSVTMRVHLDDGRDAFHKPFHGVEATLAAAYGHRPEEPPLHECLAWRVAFALGDHYRDLVAACVIREIDGAFGSLSALAFGTPDLVAAIREAPEQCSAAAFFDALIGQQDRHDANLRWDDDAGQLRLIDHGFAFKRADDILNNGVILGWRLRRASASLTDEEVACLERVRDGELDEILEILDPVRADDLRSRAATMLVQGALIQP